MVHSWEELAVYTHIYTLSQSHAVCASGQCHRPEFHDVTKVQNKELKVYGFDIIRGAQLPHSHTHTCHIHVHTHDMHARNVYISDEGSALPNQLPHMSYPASRTEYFSSLHSWIISVIM